MRVHIVVRGTLVLSAFSGIVSCASSRAGVSSASEADVSATSPPHRMHHAVAYDAAGRRVIVYGGAHRVSGSESPALDDMWSWDGRRWSQIAAHAGVVTVGHRLFADGAGGIFVVDGQTGQTSRWGGRRMVSVTTDSSQARNGAAGAWDSRRHRYVSFGGSMANRPIFLGDTWEFDGREWVRVATDGPTPVQAASMAFDAGRGVTVLFGGSALTRRRNGETWEWDGRSWTRVATTGPSARSTAGMVYDSRRNEMVLFGGLDSTGVLGDTWSWNGREWRRIDVQGPPPRSEAFMAFDVARGVAVLFGGFGKSSPPSLGDTWEWDGKSWRVVR